jgi:hypothetical protein
LLVAVLVADLQQTAQLVETMEAVAVEPLQDTATLYHLDRQLQ